MNTTIVVFVALMVAVATAAPRGGHSEENNSNSSEFSQLTTAQRTCIASAIKADSSIIAALKNCHTTHGGLACVKAIPALATCFATAG